LKNAEQAYHELKVIAAGYLFIQMLLIRNNQLLNGYQRQLKFLKLADEHYDDNKI